MGVVTSSVRRHRAGTALSVLLVALTGGLGLFAGYNSGQLAVATHVRDRLALQHDLAALSDQWAQTTQSTLQVAVSSQGAEAGLPSWPAGPSLATDRLAQLRVRAPQFDLGFELLSARGDVLASSLDAVPDPADPGWSPLRAAVSNGARVPVTGVLHVGGRPTLAAATDVHMSDGTRGLVIGLLHAEPSQLQRYTGELTYDRSGTGWVIDERGYVAAARDFHDIGRLLPNSQVRTALLAGVATHNEGFLRSPGGTDVVASYARVGTTGWVSLTTQNADDFLGPLVRATHRAEAAVLVLLLLAGAGLFALHRRRTQALQDLSVHDELTGLLNRRGWFEQASLELQRATRSDEQRVVLFVDVDGLKQVNDVLGHREGDVAICEAAAVLRKAFRATDSVGRLGGDEFVVLLGTGGDPTVARLRLTTSLSALNAAPGRSFDLRLSVGAETWSPADPCSVEELVRRADAVMYVDKQRRPDRHRGVLRLPVLRTAEPSPEGSVLGH